jgi:hypothetical protein
MSIIFHYVQGTRSHAVLMSTQYPNGTAVPGARGPEGSGSRALHGLFWQLRGGACLVHSDYEFVNPHGANPKDPWIPQYVGCTIALQGNVSEVLPLCLISPHQAGPGFESWDVLKFGLLEFWGGLCN